jgi:hypothetical protein
MARRPVSALVRQHNGILGIFDERIVNQFGGRRGIAVGGRGVNDMGVKCEDKTAQVAAKDGLVVVGGAEDQVYIDGLVCEAGMSKPGQTGGSSARTSIPKNSWSRCSTAEMLRSTEPGTCRKASRGSKRVAKGTM